MGCNCRKPKPRPRPTSNAKPQPPKKASGQTQTFVLTDRSGRAQTFGSRLEAEAANARSGGWGVVREVRG